MHSLNRSMRGSVDWSSKVIRRCNSMLAGQLLLVGIGIIVMAPTLVALSPQQPYTGPNYQPQYTADQSQTGAPSNEVRVDPFVSPASSVTSTVGNAPSATPYKSSGSSGEVTALQNQSAGNEPRTFAPSAKAIDGAGSPIALKPRTTAATSETDGSSKPRSSSFGAVLTMFTSLLVVIMVFFGFMFMLKKANGGSTSELPRDVFQILGTSRLAGRHSLFLLRLGHKLVLVHAGSGEVQAITEVTDPAEVDRLCGSCEENQPNSLTQSFKQVLKNVTEGKNTKPKSFADNLRFRGKAKDDDEEISPAMALLAKEKP